jgi:cell division protein FtsQ
MRKNKSPPLRGSVTQNNTVRMPAHDQSGIGFLTRLGILAACILIVVGIVALLWHRGWPQRQAERLQETGITLTQKAQFAVKDIVVEGRHQSSKDEIFDALGTERGAPIFDFNAKAAAARIAKLSWIDTAVVERRLPDTVAVIITERVPAARWQHDDHLYVIDLQGRVLTSAKPDDFPDLPIVVGMGADREAQAFLKLVRAYPNIAEKVNAAVRVGDRRWDLHLQSKIIVRLPEDEVGAALHRLSVLITQEKILDRDIAAVDLRVPDRLIIEPAATTKPTGASKL